MSQAGDQPTVTFQMKFAQRKLTKLLTVIGALGFVTIITSHIRRGYIRECPKVRRQPAKLIFKWLRGYNESVHQKLPGMGYLKSLSWPDVAKIYHSYIENIQIICGRMVRVGHLKDGGWEICSDQNHLPVPPCLVYSFGIGDDFSFDDEMAQRYGCSVHSFDPSIHSGDHRRSDNVTFHNTGLSHFDGYWTTWPMRRLDSIVTFLGHQSQKLDIVKLDIEQWEWKALPDMLASGRMDTVSQLLVEFHISFRPQPKRQVYLDSMKVLKSLYDAGFRIFYTRRNLHCSFKQIFDNRQMAGCHEVHMIRIK